MDWKYPANSRGEAANGKIWCETNWIFAVLLARSNRIISTNCRLESISTFGVKTGLVDIIRFDHANKTANI